MKKFMKVLWILAACMAGLGILITAWGFTWSMRVADRLTPEKSVPVSFPMDMLTVNAINIDLGVGDVRFAVDDEARIEATGFTEDDLQIRQDGSTVSVEGRKPLGSTHILNLGFFRIDWLGRLHVGTLEKRVVTVYLPKRTALDVLSVEVGVGDTTGKLIGHIEDASFKCGTDDLEIEDFFCTNLVVDYGTGDVTMKNVNVLERAEISCDTGDISFEDVTSTQYTEISCRTGDLALTDCKWYDFSFNGGTGMLVIKDCSADNSATFHHRTDDLLITNGSWNDLVIDMTSGDVEFDGHLTGNCKMTSSTGNIKLKLDETYDAYTASFRTSTGDINVENAYYNPVDKKEYAVNPGISLPNSIDIDISTGDVTLIFAQE